MLLNFDYAYDGNGNCIRKSGEQYQNEYAYDRMNRLVSAVQDGQEEKYAYDPVGNRLKKESVQGIETYHYNAKNQLTHIQSGADTLRYLYDKQGNLLEEQGEANRKQYSYDTANRQVSIASAKADGATRKLFQTNRYDGEGLRYETEENGKVIRFLFDCGELAQEKKEDVDIDYAHYGVEADGTWVSGPDAPHVGWQYGTKGKVVGHIILDFVPTGRDSSYSDLLEEIFKKMRLTWPKNF